MGLREYRRKRRFDVTPEPQGSGQPSTSRHLYVLQKHAASRLHYDLRLELDGVLKSWAVPKGPSLDPTQRVLAVHVEDHPIEYGSFEGIIPKGQYGGGTVMLWDSGTWKSIGDASKAYARGRLKFELHGKKLRGIWNLVRMGKAEPGKKSQWLLIKHADEFARPVAEYSVLTAEPYSVKSGKGLEEIAQANAAARPTRRAGGNDAVTIAGVRLTNPDKVLDAESGLTKQALAHYYEAVADAMLPHVAGRPLTIVRCPDGVGGKSFYQKHVNATFPSALRGVAIRQKDGEKLHLVLDDVRGLVSLAQLGVLEIHVWGCRADQVERPDRVVFDLDPAPDVAWKAVRIAALLMRALLRELKLESFVKLSGGKGVHVVVPIERRNGWDEVEGFARAIAGAFATSNPSQYVDTMSKAKRHGRIYIDYLRNQRGSTCVAAYSTRARPGAAVSLPIEWAELAKTGSGADFKVSDVLRRVATAGDAWKNMSGVRQRLPAKLGP